MRPLIIAGNWKMNCGPAETKKLLASLKKQLPDLSAGVEVLVCPPSISLTTASDCLNDSVIRLGAQNVHFKDTGAYTGEISVQMLSEIDCEYVITGHSERRDYFMETDEMVNLKTKKVLESGMKPIVCVGEFLWQRQDNNHQKIVEEQVQKALKEVDKASVQNVVFAYEPIWAIGTGETATPEQAQEMHKMIRAVLTELYDQKIAESILILYGGSMKSHNAEELLKQPDVDGGLIGGASLKAKNFADIIEIAAKLV